MKLRIDPISLTIVSLISSFIFYQVFNDPICPVEEVHEGKVVHVPYKCSDVLSE